MTSVSVIIAALSVMTGAGVAQVDLDKALGESKAEIISEVENLEGSRLSMIKETIDVVAKYDTNIRAGHITLANNSDAMGVSYSTDPEESIVLA